MCLDPLISSITDQKVTKQKIGIFSLFSDVLWVISRKPANFSTLIFIFFKSVNYPQSSCQEWMPSWPPGLEKSIAVYGCSCQLPVNYSRVGARPAHSTSTNRQGTRKPCLQLPRDEIIAKSGWPGSQVQQPKRNEAENGACAQATPPAFFLPVLDCLCQDDKTLTKNQLVEERIL